MADRCADLSPLGCHLSRVTFKETYDAMPITLASYRVQVRDYTSKKSPSILDLSVKVYSLKKITAFEIIETGYVQLVCLKKLT